MSTATIDPAQRVVTLITVHDCTPENQQALADLLAQAVETLYRHMPGFVSASIHKSLDGVRVTNYAQYESREAFEALRGNPALLPFIAKVNQLINRADPHLYEVVRTFGPR